MCVCVCVCVICVHVCVCVCACVHGVNVCVHVCVCMCVCVCVCVCVMERLLPQFQAWLIGAWCCVHLQIYKFRYKDSLGMLYTSTPAPNTLSH